MISYNDQYDKNKDLIEKRDGIMIKLSREKEHEQEVAECQAIWSYIIQEKVRTMWMEV